MSSTGHECLGLVFSCYYVQLKRQGSIKWVLWTKYWNEDGKLLVLNCRHKITGNDRCNPFRCLAILHGCHAFDSWPLSRTSVTDLTGNSYYLNVIVLAKNAYPVSFKQKNWGIKLKLGFELDNSCFSVCCIFSTTWVLHEGQNFVPIHPEKFCY